MLPWDEFSLPCSPPRRRRRKGHVHFLLFTFHFFLSLTRPLERIQSSSRGAAAFETLERTSVMPRRDLAVCPLDGVAYCACLGGNRANANAPAAHFDRHRADRSRNAARHPSGRRVHDRANTRPSTTTIQMPVKRWGDRRPARNAEYLAFVDDSRCCARKPPAWCSLHSSQLICHGMPKRSTSMPKRAAQNVFSSARTTLPPLASSRKIRSASATLLI